MLIINSQFKKPGELSFTGGIKVLVQWNEGKKVELVFYGLKLILCGVMFLGSLGSYVPPPPLTKITQFFKKHNTNVIKGEFICLLFQILQVRCEINYN